MYILVIVDKENLIYKKISCIFTKENHVLLINKYYTEKNYLLYCRI